MNKRWRKTSKQQQQLYKWFYQLSPGFYSGAWTVQFYFTCLFDQTDGIIGWMTMQHERTAAAFYHHFSALPISRIWNYLRICVGVFSLYGFHFISSSSCCVFIQRHNTAHLILRFILLKTGLAATCLQVLYRMSRVIYGSAAQTD